MELKKTTEMFSLFSYKDEKIHSEEYNFIKKYSKIINKYLLEHEIERHQMKRFILIGFLLEFALTMKFGDLFSFNIKKHDFTQEGIDQLKSNLSHVKGVECITLNRLNNPEESNFEKKVKIFKSLYSDQVNSAKDYMKLINFSAKHNIDENDLFNYVINGTPLDK
jgi:hypothetical protein